MAGIPNQEYNQPGKRPTEEKPEVVDPNETEHRRAERNADNAARRARERMHENEVGNDEFTNIGPI